jgi:hypothetical protein
MATVNLGRIKPVFRGAYSGSTAYVVDDIVTHGNESFICIQAHGAGTQATSQTAYWTKLAAKGTDGTDVGTTITTQGDILYRDGSGLQRLAKGTAGQALKMNSGATAPEWGTISAGTYSVHAISKYTYTTQVTGGGSGTNYIDIAGGNYVQFQPTSTNDLIHITHSCAFEIPSTDYGGDVYMMMKEGSASIGSGDTTLNYDGNHANYSGQGSHYQICTKSFILPCTGLNTSSVYYLEQAGAQHNSNNMKFNYASSSANGSYRAHNVVLIHYKA